MEAAKYCLIPEEKKSPQVVLSPNEKNIIGRKVLSELNITSLINHKKLCVSRKQIELEIFGKYGRIRVSGINPIFVTKSHTGRAIRLELGEETFVGENDSFTLCGTHFPFVFAKLNDDKPKVVVPQTEPSSNTPPSLVKQENNNTLNAHNGENSSVTENNIKTAMNGSVAEGKLGKNLIGRKVRVFWNKESTWFDGMVSHYDGDKDEYEVSYSDGDVTFESLDSLIFVQDKEKLIQEGVLDKSGIPNHSAYKKLLSRGGSMSGSMRSYDEGNGFSKKRKFTSDEDKKGRRARKDISYIEWISSSDEEPEKKQKKKTVRQKPKLPVYETQVSREVLGDKKTVILTHDICLRHYVPKWHLEKPERIMAVMSGIELLVEQFPDNIEVVRNFDPAKRDVLLMVHDDTYLRKIEAAVPKSEIPMHVSQLTEELERDPEDRDTWMSEKSLEAALLAAGSVCKAVDLVHSGKYRNAFCAIRPPGHHCGRSGHTHAAKTQGYCILNNVAVGTVYAIEKYGYERVAVFDFDVHHGNGTEEILSNNPKVLFISTHVGCIYPQTGGDDESRAPNVVNISLEPASKSEDFMRHLDQTILPAIDNFKPQLLILSSGFDAHHKDPTEDGMKLNEKDYFELTTKLRLLAEKHCNGKIVSVLEGGYHLPSLRRCAKEHVISLMMKTAPKSSVLPPIQVPSSISTSNGTDMNIPSNKPVEINLT